MTMEFLPVETIMETFEPLRNGQVRVRRVVFDNLLEKQKSSYSDVRSGDISVQTRERQQTVVIFKDGTTQSTRTGRLESLNAGEMPYFFAEQLVLRKLSQAEKSSGQIEVSGFDESLERGVIFDLRDRNNQTFGNFLTSGYRIPITPNSIKTIIDALKLS